MTIFTSIVGEQQLKAMQELAATMPPGCFCEVGVFKGGSAYKLYEVALASGRDLHLFDTFTGTPYHVPELDHHKIDGEFFAPETVEKIIYDMPMAKVHIGVYPETHPEGLKDIAFVHCDCDQYDSYKAVIGRMWPLVVPGGIMLFDDYPYLKGAKQAVEETFAREDLRLCLSRHYVVKDLG